MGRWVPPAAIAIAALVLLFGALGRADLFNPDEPREAEIAREMGASGDHLVPRLNGDPFLEKPPLFYWLVCGAYAVAGGPGELPARFPPALCGFLAVALTWLLGRDLVGERGALLAAVVLLTSFQFLWTSRRCMIDMPLTLAVLLACMALERSTRSTGPARPWWLVVFSLSVAAAVFLKGIVGAGIPALALAGSLAARRDWRGIVRPGILAAGLGALMPVGAWVLALGLRLGSGAVLDLVWVNNVLRFVGGAAKGHVQPWYYYVPTLLTDFAPWSLVLPFVLVSAAIAILRTPDQERGRLLFLVSWLVVPFLVLSIASTKRGIYLLPLYPAAALLVGWWLARAVPSRGARIAGGVLVAVTIVIAALFVSILVLVRPGDWYAAALACGIFLPLAVGEIAVLRAGRIDRVALLAAGGVGVVSLGLACLVVPEVVNRHTSPRPAASQVRRMAEAGDRLAFYRFKEGSLGAYLFYAGMTVPNLGTPEDLRLHLAVGPVARRGPRSLALMTEETYDDVAPGLGLSTSIVWRFRSGLTPEWSASGSGPPRLAMRQTESIVLVAAGGDGRAPASLRTDEEASDPSEHPDGRS